MPALPAGTSLCVRRASTKACQRWPAEIIANTGPVSVVGAACVSPASWARQLPNITWRRGPRGRQEEDAIAVPCVAPKPRRAPPGESPCDVSILWARRPAVRYSTPGQRRKSALALVTQVPGCVHPPANPSKDHCPSGRPAQPPQARACYAQKKKNTCGPQPPASPAAAQSLRKCMGDCSHMILLAAAVSSAFSPALATRMWAAYPRDKGKGRRPAAAPRLLRRLGAPAAPDLNTEDDEAATGVANKFGVGGMRRNGPHHLPVSGDAMVVSTASCAPFHKRRPFAMTSMRRSSKRATATFRSRTRVLHVTRAPASLQNAQLSKARDLAQAAR